MTALLDLFLNSTGRIGRRAFLLGGGTLLGFWTVWDLAIPAHEALTRATAAVLAYCGFCVLSQRLHDRGRAGWWSGPILLLVVVTWPSPAGLLDWAAAALLAVVAADLCLMPGQAVFNRYGAPPGAPRGGSPG